MNTTARQSILFFLFRFLLYQKVRNKCCWTVTLNSNELHRRWNLISSAWEARAPLLTVLSINSRNSRSGRQLMSLDIQLTYISVIITALISINLYIFHIIVNNFCILYIHLNNILQIKVLPLYQWK